MSTENANETKYLNLRGTEILVDKVKEFVEDVRKEIESEIGGGSQIENFIVKTTYGELRNLVNTRGLIPGKKYRITDYETITIQSGTMSAGHQFDIIVTALDESTLSEEAEAIQNYNDGYFDDSNLSAWKIWYSLDNNTERFKWADSENGTGVIYRMIDEWGNDCPYDFKNIMFKRGLYADGGGIAIKDGDEDFFAYCYTFSWEDNQNVIMDASIFGNNRYLLNDEGQISGVYGNIIGLDNLYDGLDETPQSTKQYLNDIVFLSTYDFDGRLYYGCYSNTFGNNCRSISFDNNCCINTFGNGCYANKFGNDCSTNLFGDDCSSNFFGNNCYINTFGNGCSVNVFGDDCYSNKFGNDYSYNTFGNDCCLNTFGNGCSANVFGNNCYLNTFGNSCYQNILTNDCFNNTFDTSCFKNNVTGSMQKYSIKKGVSNKNINVEFINSEIGIDVWVTSSGELVQEPINSYIPFSEIDLIWEKYFN